MAVETPQANQHGIVQKLHFLMGRFPKGMDLSREDLALAGWLYFYELETRSQGISESDIRWLISEAGKHLKLNMESAQIPQVVQRLMRFGVLRLTITDSKRKGYCLTRLGRSLAKNLIEETDYSSEQLNVLLNSALREVDAILKEGGGTLLQYLQHVFLGTIREKVEFKLLAIEEDLAERKRDVRRAYSGRNETDFESAIRNIQYCRTALTELVDAVQESSACVRLEGLLHSCMNEGQAPELSDILEQSLHFIYILRSRVDVMLKDVVLFIHDCVAFRSLAFTVDSRDRLRRIQERIIAHALEHEIRMPLLEPPQLPRLDFKWNPQIRERQVVLDVQRLKTLEAYSPPELPPVEPAWKEPLLELARKEWKTLSRHGKVDFGEWVRRLGDKMPESCESPPLAVWYLSQDWPKWIPKITLEHQKGVWVPLGEEWMMEAFFIVPVP